jgi:(1->4)-alpha-D-glucan 1-alpha-D-glucosylmutase
MPGVPDVYQGCELAGFALVDPDNRGAVDYARRRAMLDAVSATPATSGSAEGSLDASKMLICARALRLRREHPDWFAGSCQELAASGPARGHCVAFSRAGQCVTVATRLPATLRRDGGWRDTALPLPAGKWQDVLTAATYSGGDIPLAELMTSQPVALLVLAPAADAGAGAR